ncbi:MAG: RNA methyltransferase [Microbacteriaceae bacterium]
MITNPRSPRVRAAAKLAKKNARSLTGLFLVEGPQSLSEAVQYVPELIDQVFLTPEAEERNQKLCLELSMAGVELVYVSEKVLETLSDTVSPQGIIAVCRQPNPNLSEFLRQELKTVVILEQVRDPGNAGTIIRVADAAGIDGVIVTEESVDIFNPKVVRSTTGSLFHIPVFTGIPLATAIEALRSQGIKIYAADISGSSIIDARAAGKLSEPHAWLFGNEAHGLSAEDLQSVDEALIIPIFGKAESLNLATAASVCIYESAFAQRS